MCHMNQCLCCLATKQARAPARQLYLSVCRSESKERAHRPTGPPQFAVSGPNKERMFAGLGREIVYFLHPLSPSWYEPPPTHPLHIWLANFLIDDGCHLQGDNRRQTGRRRSRFPVFSPDEGDPPTPPNLPKGQHKPLTSEIMDSLSSQWVANVSSEIISSQNYLWVSHHHRTLNSCMDFNEICVFLSFFFLLIFNEPSWYPEQSDQSKIKWSRYNSLHYSAKSVL